jgi:hypothetical protein
MSVSHIIMTWLTRWNVSVTHHHDLVNQMECQCHTSSQTSSFLSYLKSCPSFHIHDIIPKMTYNWVFSIISITGTSSGAENTTYYSKTPNFPQVFSRFHVDQSLLFCVVFCGPLCFCLLAIVLSVLLWFMTSQYPFDTFS